VVALFCPAGTALGIYHDASAGRRALKAEGTRAMRPPKVILVDQATASTAEWVAGVLKEVISSKLVGQPTYGKSRVQHVSEVAPKKFAILTEGQVDLPSGHPVEERGLRPDFTVPGRAAQLAKAVEMLKI
jgi:carboxyl-terminal processing protease